MSRVEPGPVYMSAAYLTGRPTRRVCALAAVAAVCVNAIAPTLNSSVAEIVFLRIGLP